MIRNIIWDGKSHTTELRWRIEVSNEGTLALDCNDDTILKVYEDCDPDFFKRRLDKLTNKDCDVS